MTTKVADGFANEQETLFLRRNDLINRWGNVISSFQALPGMVGFWPMSSVQRSTGNVYDLSGQGRLLTYNGNPTFNYTGLVPYIELDGTGDYLSRADETDLDILGTETIYNSTVRGLTVGGWFYVSGGNGSNRGFIGKADADGQVSFYLLDGSSNVAQFIVSPTGALSGAAVGVSSPTVSLSTWYFVVGRFVPSTSLDIYLNGLKSTNATGIPASIFSSTSNLNLGRVFGGNLLTGRASLCFLSANALSDSQIFSLYEQSRVLFGV